ncbi:hypothetical protein [Mycoplasmopsis felis]|uniref:hypothetical protein n=1 Tax=Mycoplasmopsis felis TaxID=33923 RepID=UPI0021AF59EA|nr:hypothetical protein [Mycoplasmopsis felis]UWV84094.1 hypothetical protein NWE58_00995 [Mycoplasmopsis felis]
MDKKVNVANVNFFTPLRGYTPSKKIKKGEVCQDLKAEEFYKIYQEYKSTGIYVALWRCCLKFHQKFKITKRRIMFEELKKLLIIII